MVLSPINFSSLVPLLKGEDRRFCSPVKLCDGRNVLRLLPRTVSSNRNQALPLEVLSIQTGHTFPPVPFQLLEADPRPSASSSLSLRHGGR